MINKYGFKVSDEILKKDQTRLINQLWKVLPMKENDENWEKQLDTVIYELIGLNSLFNNQLNSVILFSKLESLKSIETFSIFRKTIFESINLLGELFKNE